MPPAVRAPYTFHWECGHSNPLEPVLDIFQEIHIWANANNIRNWTLVSFLFICMFCMNFSCTYKPELWSDFKKKTKWDSCVKKTFVCGFQMLCQLIREICIIYLFYQIMLTWAILGYLMPFLRPRSLLQSTLKSSVHPVCVLLMVINQKGNRVSVFLICPCEGHKLYAVGYWSFLPPSCPAALLTELKVSFISVKAAHKGQPSHWCLSANSCRTNSIHGWSTGSENELLRVVLTSQR